MTLENSPSKVAAADQPLSHFFSTDAVTSAESATCPAPLTTKLAPGSAWKVAAIDRSGWKSCAPGETAAQGQHAVGDRKGLVGTDAEFAARVGDVLRAVGQPRARPKGEACPAKLERSENEDGLEGSKQLVLKVEACDLLTDQD
jgi:hypothetical protein